MILTLIKLITLWIEILVREIKTKWVVQPMTKNVPNDIDNNNKGMKFILQIIIIV